MKILINYTGAEEIIKIIDESVKYNYLPLDKLRLVLEKTEGYNMFFKFYKNNNFKEDYIEMLKDILEYGEYNTDSEVLKRMSVAYKTAFKNTKILYQKLENVKKININHLESKLLECLPCKTKLVSNVYFILDGFNLGSIVNNHTMCLDVMGWPIKEEISKQMESVLLHEFHHIGAMYWEEKDIKRKNLIKRKNGVSLAIDLFDSILGEGTAFYFFNDNVDMYEINKDIYGEEFAESFKMDYCKSKDNMKDKIEELDEFLMKLMEDSLENYDELKFQLSDYTCIKDNKEALDKVIGSHMCKIIEEAFGKDKILECIKELQKFPIIYNKACYKLGNEERFSDKLINLWNNIWNN